MNIVYDLGGVVFNWRPDEIIESIFPTAYIQKTVKTEIFDHSDWVELDRGTLDLTQAIDRAAIRTNLPRPEIVKLMDEIPRALTPIHESITLLKSISRTENRIFVLSNMHLASVAHLEREHSIWDMFDGMVFSCRVQKVKPEIEIYQYLLDEFDLIAKETVFIDDMDVNLEAAATLGIKTIKFINPSQCRADLSELKCI